MSKEWVNMATILRYVQFAQNHTMSHADVWGEYNQQIFEVMQLLLNISPLLIDSFCNFSRLMGFRDKRDQSIVRSHIISLSLNSALLKIKTKHL